MYWLLALCPKQDFQPPIPTSSTFVRDCGACSAGLAPCNSNSLGFAKSGTESLALVVFPNKQIARQSATSGSVANNDLRLGSLEERKLQEQRLLGFKGMVCKALGRNAGSSGITGREFVSKIEAV